MKCLILIVFLSLIQYSCTHQSCFDKVGVNDCDDLIEKLSNMDCDDECKDCITEECISHN